MTEWDLEEQYQEVIDYRKETEIKIDEYLENLTEAKLKGLSNGSMVFIKTEEMKEIEDLNEDYFYEASKNWMQENKKYFDKKIEWEENGMGMMESETTYTFNKTNIEKVEKEIVEYKQTDEYKEKLKEKQEAEKRYNELHKLAKELSDEDFEDVTGLLKDFLVDDEFLSTGHYIEINKKLKEKR